MSIRISLQSSDALERALATLRMGGTLVYPTETCYGLGCDARNSEAVGRVFDIKMREKGKPVLVIADDSALFMKYVERNETIEELARTYWPGPLTIVATLKDGGGQGLATGVIGENNSIAFRVTSHPFAAALTRELGAPLVSTSANISTHSDPYDIDYIVDMFHDKKNQPDMIIDAGDLPHHSPSTIVRVEVDGTKTILRQGEIIIED
jgi:L-threonylcarbamoyladenylate synthase